MNDVILLDHGSGGIRTRDLIENVFLRHFGDTGPAANVDAALIENRGGTLAVTTDAHVVKPVFFPGGNIGRLAVCGTVNDLAVAGARPLHLTATFILEEGLETKVLEKVVDSMADAAREAGVTVVAGDTKVVERGLCDALYISTTGIGAVYPGFEGLAEAQGVAPGDAVLVSGSVGRHGAAIAAARYDLGGEREIASDCAPLGNLIASLLEPALAVRFMRDATRGGAATVLCELAEMREVGISLHEDAIPVDRGVRAVCELYGFDPLYLANEGTFIAVVSPDDAETSLRRLREHPYGRDAAIIGSITEEANRRVSLTTRIGGRRVLRIPAGGQLPRIC